VAILVSCGYSGVMWLYWCHVAILLSWRSSTDFLRPCKQGVLSGVLWSVMVHNRICSKVLRAKPWEGYGPMRLHFPASCASAFPNLPCVCIPQPPTRLHSPLPPMRLHIPASDNFRPVFCLAMLLCCVRCAWAWKPEALVGQVGGFWIFPLINPLQYGHPPDF